MVRVAFVNMARYSRQVGKITYAEPVHLLAMHNISRGEGHTSQVFQFKADEGASVREIREFKPEVIGLSFIGSPRDCIGYAHALLQVFPETERPKLIVGGTDVRHRRGYYVEQLGPYFAGRESELLFVVGQGESTVSMLASAGFKWSDNRLLAPLAEWTEYDNGFPVVIDPPAWPLDQQSFLRPYPDLLLYRHNAEVKWNVGCWARCSFCANEPTALDYRSPDLVLQELAHLRGLGAKNIGIAAANFLADPHRTSKIVDILPDDFSYVFFSRVDSLYLAIEGYPDIWRRFSIWRNRIQLGVESFLPERLAPDRLGKYPSLRQAMSQEKKLKAILDFFAGTSVIIDAELIWLDWKMTLEEDEKDREILKALLSAYPDNFQTSNGSFMNYLRYSRGSRLAEEMKPVDFFDFQRDPRLLFLYAVIETSVRDDPRINWMESAEPWNHQLVVPLLDYITLCRGVIKELPVETFTLGPILEIILREEKERDSKVSEAFYAQLPRDLAEKLRSLFDLAAEEIFGQNSER